MGIQINGTTNNINAGIGSLSIEDIRELDITGVATASNFKTGISNLHNLGLTLSGGQLDVGSNIKLGNAGVVTATSFVGSGANLTGLPAGTTINTNADNRVITGSDTANTLNGESTLLFSNGRLDVTQTTSSSDAKVVIRNSNTPGSGSLRLEFQYGTGNTEGTDRFRFGYVEGYRHGGSNDGGLIFGTKPSNAAAPTERLRIKPNGYVGIGTANPQRPLSVTSGTSGITAEFNIPDNSPTGSAGLSLNIVNRTNSSYSPLSMNATVYTFGLSGVEKVRIDNNGNLCVGITGGSAKFHTKGDQGGGLIKCDAAEGTTRFFVTGHNTAACELNMYNDAGTQATIIKAGASNNSTDIHTTQAGGRFRVYVTPNSGRTHRSGIFRPFQIDEYGELRQERGSEGWTSGFYETNNGGVKYHHRHAYTGASSANVNLIRVRRHYWGAGNYKFIVKNTYYGGSWESHFWLNGHAANGNTSSFNISHNNQNSGNSNWIQKTATSHSSPGNNYSGWTDVFISIPAYHYFDIRIETSMMNSHSYDINNLGNDAYALHPFS